ncbi:sensory rhodopsin transducer [Mycobacterium aquaticum]|uniref:sensory rhodopsin transducer n=1 Tax=Mycobacterium aquaticum TaxID=1927124 RepID=UPI001B80D7B8|nr:sensory rhodopsin transducer [Mycobacterium aquaticum]
MSSIANDPAVRTPLGAHRWVIGDGFIPPTSTGPEPAMTSHESLCILNANDDVARLELTFYFTDRDPAGPFRLDIAPKRALHQRINDLRDPEPIRPGIDYCVVVTSDQPIVVQHTRVDTRQAENATMSTIAYPA